MTDFWNNIQNAKFDNEASVEQNLVTPLLHALGYDNSDISPKHRVIFHEGRKGRPHEADFVVFYGSTHDRNTSLIVVEAKTPGESLVDAKNQGESYAVNIRAPFLLLTDGINLEIWQLQPTQESQCFLQTLVQSLCAVQGKIEGFLAKEASFEYCRSLTYKNILLTSGDFKTYETAELRRTAKYSRAVERTLSNTIGNQENNFCTSQLLSNFPNGAVILAPSGFGKTTLSYSLLRNAIENHRAAETNQLPFDVPLPDFAETGDTVFEFMRKRIKPHHSSITNVYLEDLIRDKGAILLCDGFDRLSAERQRKTETELKNLMRDFPMLQLFVFSRGSIKFELPLPVLELKPFTIEQQSELLKFFPEKDNLQELSLINRMPKILLDLCTHPLLLARTLEYWQREEKLPSKFEELFRFWLDTLLCTDIRDGVDGIDREAALTLLAKATRNTPINKIKALNLLREHHFPGVIFNELLRCGAIRISGL